MAIHPPSLVAYALRGESSAIRVPHALLDEAELRVADHLALRQPEQRLVEADVDLLPLAAARDVALVDGPQQADQAERGGDRVREREGGQRRRPVGEPGKGRNPAEGFRHGAVPGPVRIGPGLPVAGDAHDDDARVRRRQLVDRTAPASSAGGSSTTASAHSTSRRKQPAALRFAEVERGRARSSRPVTFHQSELPFLRGDQ